MADESASVVVEIRARMDALERDLAAAHVRLNVFNNSVSNGGRKAAKDFEGAYDNVSRVLSNVANALGVIQGPLGPIAGRFSAISSGVMRLGLVLGGAGLALAGLGKGVYESVQAFAQLESEQAKYNAVLRATGFAAGKTADDIEAMATSIRQGSTATEGAVREAAAKLLTFKSVSGDAFNEALTLSADLAAIGFGSVTSAALMMGKALEDPERGLMSLRRAGVQFTQSQKTVIKDLLETGQRAKAVQEILKEVNSQVGGAAAASAATLRGAYNQLSESVNNLLERWGATIAKSIGLDSTVRALASAIDAQNKAAEHAASVLGKLEEAELSYQSALARRARQTTRTSPEGDVLPSRRDGGTATTKVLADAARDLADALTDAMDAAEGDELKKFEAAAGAARAEAARVAGAVEGVTAELEKETKQLRMSAQEREIDEQARKANVATIQAEVAKISEAIIVRNRERDLFTAAAQRVGQLGAAATMQETYNARLLTFMETQRKVVGTTAELTAAEATRAQLALKVDVENQFAQRRLSILGEAVTAQERYNETVREMNALMAVSPELANEARRRISAAGIEKENAALSGRVSLLGDMANIEDVVRQKELAINEANKNGANITREQTAALLEKARVQAEAAGPDAQIRIQREALFLTEQEAQIRQQLLAWGERWNSEEGERLAGLLRFNNQLKEIKDISTAALSGFAKDIANGVKPMDVVVNQAKRLQDIFIDMAAKRIVNEAMGAAFASGANAVGPTAGATSSATILTGAGTTLAGSMIAGATAAFQILTGASAVEAEARVASATAAAGITVTGETVAGAEKIASTTIAAQLWNLITGNWVAAVIAAIAAVAALAFGIGASNEAKELRKAKEAWAGMADQVRDFNEAARGVNLQPAAQALRQALATATDLYIAAYKAKDWAGMARVAADYATMLNRTLNEFQVGLPVLDEFGQKLKDAIDTAAQLTDEIAKRGAVTGEQQAKIAEGLRRIAQQIGTDFTADLQAKINEALGKGYLNQISALVTERQKQLANIDALRAQGVNVDPALIDRYFAVQAQKIIDDANLVGVAFDDLVTAFSPLAGVVHESTQAIAEQIEEQKRLADANNVAARSVVDWINDKISGPSSTLSPSATLANAQSVYNANLVLGQGGNLDAVNKWPQLAENLDKALRAMFGSSAAYQTGFNQITAQGLALPAVQAATDPVVVALRDTITAIDLLTGATGPANVGLTNLGNNADLTGGSFIGLNGNISGTGGVSERLLALANELGGVGGVSERLLAMGNDLGGAGGVSERLIALAGTVGTGSDTQLRARMISLASEVSTAATSAGTMGTQIGSSTSGIGTVVGNTAETNLRIGATNGDGMRGVLTEIKNLNAFLTAQLSGVTALPPGGTPSSFFGNPYTIPDVASQQSQFKLNAIIQGQQILPTTGLNNTVIAALNKIVFNTFAIAHNTASANIRTNSGTSVAHLFGLYAQGGLAPANTLAIFAEHSGRPQMMRTTEPTFFSPGVPSFAGAGNNSALIARISSLEQKLEHALERLGDRVVRAEVVGAEHIRAPLDDIKAATEEQVRDLKLSRQAA